MSVIVRRATTLAQMLHQFSCPRPSTACSLLHAQQSCETTVLADISTPPRIQFARFGSSIRIAVQAIPFLAGSSWKHLPGVRAEHVQKSGQPALEIRFLRHHEVITRFPLTGSG